MACLGESRWTPSSIRSPSGCQRPTRRPPTHSRCRRPPRSFIRAAGERLPRTAVPITAPTVTCCRWRAQRGSCPNPGVLIARTTRRNVARASGRRKRFGTPGLAGRTRLRLAGFPAVARVLNRPSEGGTRSLTLDRAKRGSPASGGAPSPTPATSRLASLSPRAARADNSRPSPQAT